MQDWIYLTFDSKTGRLLDDDGVRYVEKTFATPGEAERWLEENECRATLI